MEVLVFPYLPISDVVSIGGWRLVPGGAAANASPTAEVQRCVDGLLGMYGHDDKHPRGAVVTPPAGRIGDEIPRSEMPRLRRAVLVGALEGNPTPPALLSPDEEPHPNGGWASITSDNVVLWGHPIDESGYTAVEYGAMVTVLSGGHNVLRSDTLKIEPPAELPRAFMYRGFDGVYADAAYAVLSEEDDRARRLGRAIDWLDLAWRNSPSVTPEMRVVLIRTGFEILFESSATSVVRDALSAALDVDGVVLATRTWRNLSGAEQTAELSELAWWFQQLAFLRNAIMHGDELDPAQFDHDGRSHVWIGQARLRDAIKECVAEAGYPDVRVAPATRARDARVQTAMEILRRRDASAGDDASA